MKRGYMKSESDTSMAFIKVFLDKVLAFKYIYLLCIIILGAGAFLFNKYAPREYELYSTIGPVQENRSSVLSSDEMFRSMGTYNSGKNIEDAINSLNSFSLILATVRHMNFEVGYFSEKKALFKQTSEFYLNSPFRVNIDKSHPQPINTRFYITFLNDSSYRLTAVNKKASLYNYIDNAIVEKEIPFDLDTVGNINKTITGKDYKFSISFDKEFFHGSRDPDNVYYFELFHIEELAKDYQKRLKVEPISVLASIIRIKFTGNNIDKSIGFLNTYMNSFLEENLSKKNKIAVNTINFIDGQISEMSDSLTKSESNLRNFRTANQVSTDLSYQGQQIYAQKEQVESQKTDLEAQIRYYNYIINLLKTNQDVSGVIPPSSANITDPVMDKLITDLVALNAERSGIASNNNNQKNLFLTRIEDRIKTQKQAILESATNNLNTINLTLNELNYRSEKLTNEIANLPRTEISMVNIQRRFNLNNTLLTYLLQKRSESAISLASNNPDYEILEPARSITSEIVRPNVIIDYILAIFLALFLPTVYIFIRDLLNDKITSVYEVEHILDRSILAVIFNSPKKYDAAVSEAPKSAIAESFRNLRGSLFLKFGSENKPRVILVTSSQPQDGKSFISFNLALSIASVGHKTLLVDLDLRRPSIHTKFKIENTNGISNYMTGNSSEDEIIHKTAKDNLFFIPAGPVMPNPSELIDSGALDDLIKYVKSEFEYIIIDTAPVGIVADSIQLMKYASQIIMVSRNNVTKKAIFNNALITLETNNIDNYDVILNDLNIKKSPYSGYRNYYLKT